MTCLDERLAAADDRWRTIEALVWQLVPAREAHAELLAAIQVVTDAAVDDYFARQEYHDLMTSETLAASDYDPAMEGVDLDDEPPF